MPSGSTHLASMGCEPEPFQHGDYDCSSQCQSLYPNVLCEMRVLMLPMEKAAPLSSVGELLSATMLGPEPKRPTESCLGLPSEVPLPLCASQLPSFTWILRMCQRDTQLVSIVKGGSTTALAERRGSWDPTLWPFHSSLEVICDRTTFQ